MFKVKPKPLRRTFVWFADADRVTNFRSQVVKRAPGPAGTAQDWREKLRIDRDIKRLVRAKAHLRRQVAVKTFGRTPATSLSPTSQRVSRKQKLRRRIPARKATSLFRVSSLNS